MYELSRELGIENKQVVELSQALGIDVKSHSSSMVEAQADRVRRKAKDEGIAQAPKADAKDDKPAKKASSKKAISTKKPPPKKDDDDAKGGTAPTPIKKAIKSSGTAGAITVSYTHLTLPTICSV